MAKLVDIEGVGAASAKKLEAAGVRTQAHLLKQAGTPRGRQKLAERSGIAYKRILEWVNRADLARVRGIGEEYADLLETAGVNTVPQLARRNAANLYAKMVEVNEKKKLVRTLPSEKQIVRWIDHAKTLERAIFY